MQIGIGDIVRVLPSAYENDGFGNINAVVLRLALPENAGERPKIATVGDVCVYYGAIDEAGSGNPRKEIWFGRSRIELVERAAPRYLSLIESCTARGLWEAAESWCEVYVEHVLHVAENQGERERYLAARKALDATGPRRISVTYDTVTPESAEEGDAADRGWVDFAGKPMEGDDADDPEASAVENAVAFLRYEGATEPSEDGAGDVCPRWWTAMEKSVNYKTGEETSHSYHFHGPWTDDERREVYRAMRNR